MKNLLAIVLLLAVSLPAQIPPAAGGEPMYRIRIPHSAPVALRSALEAKGYDIACMHCSNSAQVELVVSAADLDQLSDFGLTCNVQETAMPLWAKFSASRNGFAGYTDYSGINTFLNSTAAANPSIATVVDLTATYGPGSTFEGRAINAIKISDNASVDEDEPEILFVSCHHCREIVTPEIALDIISRLVSGYGTDPQITSFVDDNEIWIAPVWNPDGLEYTWNVNNLWRKNRKPFGADFGVDLNRNYPLNWAASCGASTTPSSQTYKGPSVGSEEETQTMIGFARARRFAKVMDYHSSGREILQTYNCAIMPALMENYIDSEAVNLANAITPSFGVRDPSADGEHYEFQIKEITGYSFLTETHTTFQPTHASALAEAVLVWPSTVAFLSKQIPVVGHVTDSLTGNALVADISVVGLGWTQGETRTTEPTYGRYHLWLPPGVHQVTYAAAGYSPVTLTLTVTTSTQLQNVMLLPLGPVMTLSMSTTGGGAGDLNLAMTNVPASATFGFTLFSLNTTGALGTGNAFGVTADFLTLQSLLTPSLPGNPFSWTWPVGGVYPATPFVIPPGGIPFPTGTQLDAVAVAFSAGFGSLEGQTAANRVTF
ncbi:MAG: hypothetical protein CMJ83_10710 [Planctomycetes bacterium]|nr:hypothetical protein [Planctomycetota bacterium]